MWSRAELKSNAKEILSKNYGWAVLVALILTMISTGSGFSGSNVGQSLRSASNANNESNQYDYFSENYDDEYDYFSNDYDEYDYDDEYDFFSDDDYSLKDDSLFFNSNPLWNVFGGIAITVILVILVIAVALSLFVFAPLRVGCYRWFIKNRTINPEISELVYVFSDGYLNTVKVMFLKGLYEGLWSLLFIIPGIVKSYEYKMIPYLLAENPKMSAEEAFARSREMMKGNKWDTFVLDLSFIGWMVLSIFTCGILSVLYVNPYKQITDTELYVKLCMLSGSNTAYGEYDYNTKKESFDSYETNPNGNDYSNQKGIDQDMFR